MHGQWVTYWIGTDCGGLFQRSERTERQGGQTRTWPLCPRFIIAPSSFIGETSSVSDEAKAPPSTSDVSDTFDSSDSRRDPSSEVSIEDDATLIFRLDLLSIADASPSADSFHTAVGL